MRVLLFGGALPALIVVAAALPRAHPGLDTLAARPSAPVARPAPWPAWAHGAQHTVGAAPVSPPAPVHAMTAGGVTRHPSGQTAGVAAQAGAPCAPVRDCDARAVVGDPPYDAVLFVPTPPPRFG